MAEANKIASWNYFNETLYDHCGWYLTSDSDKCPTYQEWYDSGVNYYTKYYPSPGLSGDDMYNGLLFEDGFRPSACTFGTLYVPVLIKSTASTVTSATQVGYSMNIKITLTGCTTTGTAGLTIIDYGTYTTEQQSDSASGIGTGSSLVSGYSTAFRFRIPLFKIGESGDTDGKYICIPYPNKMVATGEVSLDIGDGKDWRTTFTNTILKPMNNTSRDGWFNRNVSGGYAMMYTGSTSNTVNRIAPPVYGTFSASTLSLSVNAVV